MNIDDKILETSIAAARDYADAILLGPLQQLSGILSDTIGARRIRNQVRILLGTRRLLEQHGIDPGKVLPDILVPLLEEGSKVADVQLSEMFSSLLAQHLDPSHSAEVHPSYANVLSQLAPLDARALLRFWNRASDLEYRELGLRGGGYTTECISEALGVDTRQAFLTCLNLERLGLIERDGFWPPEGHPVPEFYEDSPGHQFFRVTEYGISFSEACNRGRAANRFAS